MQRRVSATEATARFGELMEDVVAHADTIIVECEGKPEVILLSIDEYRRIGGDLPEGEDWEALLAQTHALIRAEGRGRLVPPPEDVIREMREERDEQLLGLR